jgi:hypothetical protein
MFVRMPESHPGQSMYWVKTSDLTAGFDPQRVDFSWRGSHIYLTFPGASPASIEGVAPLHGKVNFLLGNDPARWAQDLQAYEKVIYRDLYPGIDMIYGGSSRRIKSEFVAAPGSDPSAIRMQFFGIHHLTIAPDGSLRVVTTQGELQEEAPVIFQESSGKRVPVAGHFRLFADGTIGFELGSYDHSLALTIDPAVSYSTFFGGSRNDNPMAIAVNTAGSAFVAGWTDSNDFPEASPLRGFSGSVDAFVAKFNPAGSGLVYATYIGGSGDDRALGVDIDPSGNAYVVGYTTSNNFPTVLPIQGSRAGGRDAFMLKLNAAGNVLAYSSYYGGSGNDQANGVSVDIYGQLYAVGETDSANFPTRFPFQSSLHGIRDAFTFKIGVSGSIAFSTLIGGAGDDRGTAIAVAASGLTPYIAGCTASTDFPTSNASQAALAGGQDAYVVRFNGDGNRLVYGTYLGGSAGGIGQTECANAIALDSFNNAYVAGQTPSTNFPVLGAFQAAHASGVYDAFITKLNSGGARLYSSYLGGRGVDVATGVRVDASRRAYVVGYTSSNNFPAVLATQAALAGYYDAFAVRVDVAGSSLNFATYLGGTYTDTPFGAALSSAGDLYLTGITTSPNFPLAAPFQPTLKGSMDGFLTKIANVGF